MRQTDLVERVLAYDPDADEALLNKAYVYAMTAHGKQFRASGDPYFSHPLQVAAILTDLKLDDATIESARARVLQDLERLGVTRGHKLVAHHSVVMDPAYVHITSASLREHARLSRILRANGVYSIGRYGGWTYCSIEDNIVEAKALTADFDAA